jgi:hypothetical protein
VATAQLHCQILFMIGLVMLANITQRPAPSSPLIVHTYVNNFMKQNALDFGLKHNPFSSFKNPN